MTQTLTFVQLRQCLGFGLVRLFVLLLTSCIPPVVRPGPTPTALPAPTAVVQCHYQADGALPDPACTPGATDPRVTQDNLDQTICRSGYSATVRPPVSYTNSVKRSSLQAYGVDPSQAQAYELDHLISLELGGAPRDPANLWAEPAPAPNPKDHVENELHRMVCDRQITLAEAQRRIATDWRHALD